MCVLHFCGGPDLGFESALLFRLLREERSRFLMKSIGRTQQATNATIRTIESMLVLISDPLQEVS
jgi:hypothetical protein